MPAKKISKRDVKAFPFIHDLLTLALDDLAEVLINQVYSNFKSGGLNTEQMNLILQ
jgi:hypothetical protein